MRKIGSILIGNEMQFSFENRVYNFTILLGTAMTVAAVLINLAFGGSFLIDAVFAVCWVIGYYLSRFKGCFKVASNVTIGILVFGYIPYIWTSSNGVFSAIPYYSIIFVAVIGIVLKGPLRLAMILSVMLAQHLLIIFDAGSLYAALRPPYISASIGLDLMTGSMAVLIVIYSNTFMRERMRSHTYADTIKEHYRQQLYYMENLETLIHKLKMERHDFNNHLGVIYGLLESGEADKAEAYTSQLIKTAEEYRNIVDLPYPMLRAMLNYKLSTAQDVGIRFKIDIDVPGGLALNEFDMAIILGNLLDNAVEACQTLDEDEKNIDLKLIYEPDYLIMHIENPTNGTVVLQGGDYRTTKPDSENHGFGLANIAHLVNRHNGLMKVESKAGSFSVNIAILVK